MRFLRHIGTVLVLGAYLPLYSQLDALFERLKQLQKNVITLQQLLNEILLEPAPLKPESLIPVKPVVLVPGKKPIEPVTTVPESAKPPFPPQPGVSTLPTPSKEPIVTELLPPRQKPKEISPVIGKIPTPSTPGEVVQSGVPGGVVLKPGEQITPISTITPTTVTGVPVSGVPLQPGGTGVPGIMPTTTTQPSIPPPPLSGVALPSLPSKEGVAKSEPPPGIPPPPALSGAPSTEEGGPPPPPPGMGGLPPPPPPPVLGAGILGGKLPGAKKIQTPLTPEELSAVDVPEQQLSDQTLIRTLTESSNPNLKNFKSYRDIWNNLTYQESFKKRQELQDLLKFIDDKLKKKVGTADAEFLKPFMPAAEESIGIAGLLFAIIKSMLFNQQYDSSFLADRFITNIVTVQRALINEAMLKESQKIMSDELAADALQDAVGLGAQGSLNEMYRMFDHLRLQPNFMRFATMVSTGKEKPKGGDSKSLVEELKQRAGGGAEGGPVITQPLLSILYEASVPLSTEVEQGLKSLFFFPGIEFADQSIASMIRTIMEDKRKQLAEKGTTKITLEQLTTTLLDAKDIARLKFALRSYPAINDIFSSAQLSADAIIDALSKEFGAPASNQLKKHIHNLIDPLIEQQRIARIFAEELAAAIKRFDQTNAYQDESFYKNITENTVKDRSVKKVKEFLDYFVSLYRVEFEVWEKLKSLIGTDLLKEYGIVDQKVFFLFAPYGMVLQLLSDFVKDGDFDILITSLRGLNGDHASSKGLIRPEEPNYAPVIKENKQRLSNYGLYKNMLMPIIKNFMDGEIVAALAAVTQLVDRAKLGITQKPEYQQLLQSVRAKVLTLRINAILEQLQGLNQNNPSVVIPNLPRPGIGALVGRDILLRNALIYEELAGKLTEFIKTIRDNINALSTINTATLADKVPWSVIEEHIKTLKGYEQGMQIVRGYINAIVTQISNLQKIEQATLTH